VSKIQKENVFFFLFSSESAFDGTKKMKNFAKNLCISKEMRNFAARNSDCVIFLTTDFTD